SPYRQLAAATVYPLFDTRGWPLRPVHTTLRTRPAHHHRGNLHRKGPDNYRQNTDLHRTIQRFSRNAHLHSFARLLDGGLNRPLLILFHVVTWITGQSHDLWHLWMNEIPVTSFPAPVHKTGGLQIADQFTDLTRHRLSYSMLREARERTRRSRIRWSYSVFPGIVSTGLSPSLSHSSRMIAS